ncbi:MAG: SlyX family protein [Aeromonas sp.]
MSELLAPRVDTLESRLAFAEDTVEQLNQEVISQSREIDRLKLQMKLILDRLQGLQPSQIASMSEETPPPHY